MVRGHDDVKNVQLGRAVTTTMDMDSKPVVQDDDAIDNTIVDHDHDHDDEDDIELIFIVILD